ncbi:hypothetical protein N9850_06310 [Granulosicoccus sp.]|nr:hypothetical protein [Granulosicoccus sp.]MDB4223366.1 hypothetical protein [Granulosicoccus sp.]
MEQLLKNISRCKHMDSCLTHSDDKHPCFKIVQSQNESGITQFQVPEPWSGRIDQSRILFISSNPSIGPKGDFPCNDASDEYLIDYFTNRFGGGAKQWIRDGTHDLGPDGKYSNVKFWSSIKSRAKELIDGKVVPGEDYTLTEVVHCKSKKEIGVEEALNFCSQEYLEDVLSVSSAKVIVVLGAHATQSFCTLFSEVCICQSKSAGICRCCLFE